MHACNDLYSCCVCFITIFKCQVGGLDANMVDSLVKSGKWNSKLAWPIAWMFSDFFSEKEWDLWLVNEISSVYF